MLIGSNVCVVGNIFRSLYSICFCSCSLNSVRAKTTNVLQKQKKNPTSYNHQIRHILLLLSIIDFYLFIFLLACSLFESGASCLAPVKDTRRPVGRKRKLVQVDIYLYICDRLVIYSFFFVLPFFYFIN